MTKTCASFYGLIVSFFLFNLGAFAQFDIDETNNGCRAYMLEAERVFDVNQPSDFAGILLRDVPVAARCLIVALKEIGLPVTLGESNHLYRLNRLFDAIRTIIASNEPLAIQKLREFDDTVVVEILTEAGTSIDSKTRMNAILILGNIIDNTTVCVPIDYLYNPEFILDLDGNDYRAKARANLLAVIAVVAPWAYRENWENLSRLKAYFESKDIEWRKFPKTKQVLENLGIRLKRDIPSNELQKLPEALKVDCKRRALKFAKVEQLNYP